MDQSLRGTQAHPSAGTMESIKWRILSLLESASSKRALQERLDSIRNEEELVRFLHRFLLFNDALAARVPFLAGLIHLTPGLFADTEEPIAFCQNRSGRIAAHVAEAAMDEYERRGPEDLVHQHLAQEFFRGLLEGCSANARETALRRALPETVAGLIEEAKSAFLDQRTADAILSALGFHVALEFFANE